MSGEWLRMEAKLVGSRSYWFLWIEGADESFKLVLRLSWIFPKAFQYDALTTFKYRNVMLCRSELARVSCKEAHHLWGEKKFERKSFFKFIYFLIEGLYILCYHIREVAANVI